MDGDSPAPSLVAQVAEVTLRIAGVGPSDLLDGLAIRREADRDIGAADSEGTWWPPGLLKRCEALERSDRRYAFIERIPRSWFFGTSVVRGLVSALRAEPDGRAIAAAGVMNVFVTAFDGICDDVPELLPGILPPIGGLVAQFPEPTGCGPTSDNPVVRLAWACAQSFAAAIRDAFEETSLSVRVALQVAVREAFTAQLASLNWIQPPHAMANTCPGDLRANVSAGPFRVAVLLPLVFRPDLTVSPAHLHVLALALGRHFGWIDDLVDLEQDLRFGQPNAVASLIGVDSSRDLLTIGPTDPRAVTIVDETRRRIVTLRKAMMRLGICNDECLGLVAANTIMWLGLSPSSRG